MNLLVIFPISVVFFACTGMLVAYIIAVDEGHVVQTLPYISDTGVEDPESPVFGFMFGLAAFAACFSIYFEYCYIRNGLNLKPVDAWMNVLNMIVHGFGHASAAGLYIVGHFTLSPTSKTVISFHIFGAILVIGFGTVYAMGITFLTWKLCANGRLPRWLLYVRGFITFAAVIGSILALIFMYLKYNWSKTFGSNSAMPVVTHMPPHIRRYHTVSAFMEWLLGFAIAFLMGSTAYELNKLKLHWNVVLPSSVLTSKPAPLTPPNSPRTAHSRLMLPDVIPAGVGPRLVSASPSVASVDAKMEVSEPAAPSVPIQEEQSKSTD